LDGLVWGPDENVIAGYPPDVSTRFAEYRRRFMSYAPTRPEPRERGTAAQARAAQVQYERRLFAISRDAGRAAASAYVDALKPCYEWEGFHDCPEHEARFSVNYREANPQAPFVEYLALLASHRWLCAAEAYEFEQHPAEAARTRREFERTLGLARTANDTLIRAAAAELAAQPTCFTQAR
jgi:hypothetical protein